MKSDIKTLADSVFTAVTEYFQKGLEPVNQAIKIILDRQDRLEKTIADMPIPKDGVDGKDAEPLDAEQIIAVLVERVDKALETIPPPRDGVDGKDADPAVIEALVAHKVEAAVAAIPPAKDGKDGESVDPASVEDFLDKAVTARVQEAVSALPPARDGLDGKDGEPGRHALQIDILPSINENASYARGTFASHRGGLIHALRATEPVTDTLEKAGWEVIVEGFPVFEIKQDDADPRAFTIKAQRTSGSALTTAFRIPAVIDAGFYQPEKAYREGDGTTFGGSFWIAQKDTDTKPCIGNDDWRLSVRKGRDAKRSN